MLLIFYLRIRGILRMSGKSSQGQPAPINCHQPGCRGLRAGKAVTLGAVEAPVLQVGELHGPRRACFPRGAHPPGPPTSQHPHAPLSLLDSQGCLGSQQCWRSCWSVPGSPQQTLTWARIQDPHLPCSWLSGPTQLLLGADSAVPGAPGACPCAQEIDSMGLNEILGVE